MEDKLKAIQAIINGFFDDINAPVINHFRDDFSFGKMLRSKLILAIAPDSKVSLQLAGIIELIHFASLLHDDVIDNSVMRRGKSSINAKWGDKNAIMLGDLMYSKAFYEISCIDSSLAQIVSNCVLKLSIGELEDVALSQNMNLDSTKYIQMIEHKTAALIEASAQCAGILNGYNGDKYKIYGNCLGIAFQIIDDLLDITQDSKILGKHSFSDFKEGKSTLPYIFLYHKLQKDSQMQLLSYFKKDLDSKDKAWIKAKMDKYAIIQQIKEVIATYEQKAFSVLTKSDSNLVVIMKNMLNRTF